MNAAQWVGVRVFFWDADNAPIYGTVVDDRTMNDGTCLLVIRTEAGKSIYLPAAGVTVVPP
ncbi:hypothetical protein AX15_001177 [Amanita polypyramis BW_CC]|nr:hypothetical protein AX15_001177 [Amanita polypyramis BW_CC]